MKKILEINMTVDIFVDIILPPNIMSYFCKGCSFHVYRQVDGLQFYNSSSLTTNIYIGVKHFIQYLSKKHNEK